MDHNFLKFSINRRSGSCRLSVWFDCWALLSPKMDSQFHSNLKALLNAQTSKQTFDTFVICYGQNRWISDASNRINATCNLNFIKWQWSNDTKTSKHSDLTTYSQHVTHGMLHSHTRRLFCIIETCVNITVEIAYLSKKFNRISFELKVFQIQTNTKWNAIEKIDIFVDKIHSFFMHKFNA